MTYQLHTCSYYCAQPECIQEQRDELRDRMFMFENGTLFTTAEKIAEIDRSINNLKKLRGMYEDAMYRGASV
jgi:predicted nucleotide-binding protein (sugar kinase/HSP70/actin superfamily)